MKTMMKQTELELNGILNKFARLALTDKEMVKLFGGTSTGTAGDTTTDTKPTSTTSNSGSSGNNDNPPPIVKED